MTELSGFGFGVGVGDVSVLVNIEESIISEHIEIVKAATPAPLLSMTKQNLDMLKSFTPTIADWQKNSSREQCAEARRLVEEGVAAHTALTDAMSGMKTPHEFAEPLLKDGIKKTFNLDLDVNDVRLNLSGVRDLDSREARDTTILEAALNNFPSVKKHNEWQYSHPRCFTVGSAGERKEVPLDIRHFISMCRDLDLGEQYQAHIKHELKWDEPDAQEKLKVLFIGYQKAALDAASYIALRKGDIGEVHHRALKAAIRGDKTPSVNGKPVWFRGLSFLDMPLHSCVVFEIADPDDDTVLSEFVDLFDSEKKGDFIAYIPDDPDCPVKHYTSIAGLKHHLISQFVRRQANDSTKVPTAYQQFFSRFVRYKDRATFFHSFTESYRTSPGGFARRDNIEFRQQENPDFLLQFRILDPSGETWAQHYDLGTTLFKEFEHRIFNDARSAAVPTKDADAADTASLVAQLLEIGQAALNVLSFTIPPLGAVMLGVSAVQLMDEVLEGVEELSEGDKESGWRHITDVLENIGIGVATLPLLKSIHSEFKPIELSGGQKRLWKPDLVPYRSDVSLEGIEADAHAQYAISGKRYVRIEGAVFESHVDPLIGKLRIRHPKNPQAYQPILEQDTAGNWYHTLSRRLSKPAAKSAGISNDTYRRYAVKQSDIAGMSASKGIFRSADGQQFYIRNIDEKGKVAVYAIRNSFNLNADIVDVNIVDPNTNRATELRLWQVAPDQWQPLSLRGGSNTESFDGVQSFTSSGVDNLVIAAVDTTALSSPAFTRKQLPNGLSEPVIAAGEQRSIGNVPLDWGRVHQGLPFTAEQTNIRQALSVPEFSRFIINTNLFEAGKVRYSSSVARQLANQQGGSRFVFEMQRMSYSGAVKGEFNAIKIVDIEAGEIPDQSNAVSGYWAPQGGYVDIPVHPGWADPDYVFTPGFGGCSLVVDQLEEDVLRVRHVEGNKEDAQYNKLPAGEHGWGQAAAMEYSDYGIAADQNNNADTLLGGFAFMKYDRSTRVWNIHFQSLQGTPNITRYSVAKPGLFGQSDSNVAVYEPSKVRKTMAKRVVTANEPVHPKETHAGDPLRTEEAESFA